jgi:hypothetical protein
MDARQVRVRLVADRRLITTTHVELADARQVRERLVTDRTLITLAHIESLDAAQVLKVDIHQVSSLPDVGGYGTRKTTTPTP